MWIIFSRILYARASSENGAVIFKGNPVKCIFEIPIGSYHNLFWEMSIDKLTWIDWSLENYLTILERLLISVRLSAAIGRARMFQLHNLWTNKRFMALMDSEHDTVNYLINGFYTSRELRHETRPASW